MATRRPLEAGGVREGDAHILPTPLPTGVGEPQDIEELRHMSPLEWRAAVAERRTRKLQPAPIESAREITLRLMAIRKDMGWSDDGITARPASLLDYTRFLLEHTKPGDTLVITGTGGDLEVGWAALMRGLHVVFTDVKNLDNAGEQTRRHLDLLGLPQTYRPDIRYADIRTLREDTGLEGVKVMTLINHYEFLLKVGIGYIRAQILPVLADDAYLVMTKHEREAVGRQLGGDYRMEEMGGYTYHTEVYPAKFYRIRRA